MIHTCGRVSAGPPRSPWGTVLPPGYERLREQQGVNSHPPTGQDSGGLPSRRALRRVSPWPQDGGRRQGAPAALPFPNAENSGDLQACGQPHRYRP
ncbi:hypothetical protein AGOR_G00138260 [Albula goreensis]|uniref:Uncharacterized protein n=1 Tax=Albula goreensis TaxID=1534307 RepID=A0A8T3DD79_9TELE|nr:hypothetical protein AGOR_G00138260 [Albula goreensis]